MAFERKADQQIIEALFRALVIFTGFPIPSIVIWSVVNAVIDNEE